MKIKIIVGLFVMSGLSAEAGTGHAKDLDLAYLIVLIIFALIIGAWDGIDFLKKNRKLIRDKIMSIIEKTKSYFRPDRNNHTEDFSLL